MKYTVKGPGPEYYVDIESDKKMKVGEVHLVGGYIFTVVKVLKDNQE